MNCWKICGLDAGGRWCCAAGVGKSALLEYALSTATDMRVARAAGAESEMELAFASLHLLCVPLLDRVENLPGPQRDALPVAFGLREGAVPDRFMVALAGLIFAMREPSEQFRGLAGWGWSGHSRSRPGSSRASAAGWMRFPPTPGR